MAGWRRSRLVFCAIGLLAGERWMIAQQPAAPVPQPPPVTDAPPAQQLAPAQTELKPAPETPIEEKREELGGETWNPDWDMIIETALPPEMLTAQVAKDVKPFCPRFNSMSDTDKRAFWAYFFQALAGAEAGLIPTKDVRHTEPEVAVKDTVTKRMVRSEGLLQLTYMDAERYGCNFDWEKDKLLDEKDPAKTILQPANNLTCGVKILANQLIVQHKKLLSSSSYWSTLRPRGLSYRVFAKQMENVPGACGRARRGTRMQTAATAGAKSPEASEVGQTRSTATK